MSWCARSSKPPYLMLFKLWLNVLKRQVYELSKAQALIHLF